jgi:hypothetical protein
MTLAAASQENSPTRSRPRSPEIGPHLRVQRQQLQRRGQPLRIVRIDLHAGVPDHLRQRARPRGDDGCTARHRFQHRQSEPLVVGRERERLGGRVEGRKLAVWDEAREDDVVAVDRPVGALHRRVREPAPPPCHHQFVWQRPPRLQNVERLDQPHQVLARLDDPDEKDVRRRLVQTDRVPQCRQPSRVVHWLEHWIDAAGHHRHPLRRHPQQHDDIVAGVLRVRHDEVRPLDRARHGPFEVGAQPSVGALGVQQEGQIVDRQDRAGGLHRRQHEVRRVEQIDRASQPVGRDRHLQAMPDDVRPALVEPQDASRDVRAVRIRWHPARIRVGVQQQEIVGRVVRYDSVDQAAHEPTDPGVLVDRRGVVDRDAQRTGRNCGMSHHSSAYRLRVTT